MPSYGEIAGTGAGAVVGGSLGAKLGGAAGKALDRLLGGGKKTKKASVLYRYADETAGGASFWFAQSTGEWIRDSAVAAQMYTAAGGSPPSEWSSTDGGAVYIQSGFAGAVYVNGTYYDAQLFGVNAIGKRFRDPQTGYMYMDVTTVDDATLAKLGMTNDTGLATEQEPAKEKEKAKESLSGNIAGIPIWAIGAIILFLLLKH